MALGFRRLEIKTHSVAFSSEMGGKLLNKGSLDDELYLLLEKCGGRPLFDGSYGVAQWYSCDKSNRAPVCTRVEQNLVRYVFSTE
jgi:hypothetical protein